MVYNSDQIDSLEQLLYEKQAQIDQLQLAVNNGDQSPSVSNFLNKELERAKSRIRRLEQENAKLITVNDSISDQLKLVSTSLTIAQADVVNSNEKLRLQREESELETQRQQQALAQREAENERLRELNKGLADEAEVLFKNAERSLELLDSQITNDKGNIKVGSGKKRRMFKKTLASIVDDLAKSKSLGYEKAEDLLKTIYASDKYEKIIPLGLDF